MRTSSLVLLSLFDWPQAQGANEITYHLDYTASGNGPARAAGFITLDPRITPQTGILFNEPAPSLGLLDFQITVSGVPQGNGIFGLAEVPRWIWRPSGPIDFLSDLRPQLTDFNLGFRSIEPGVPSGCGFFTICLNSETEPRPVLILQSMRPAKMVSTPADQGPGSLRQIIAEAASSDTIVFDPRVFNGEPQDTIVLRSPLVIADQTLVIDASRLPAGVTMSGGQSNRLMTIGTDAAVTLSGIHLVEGTASGESLPDNSGGAIFTRGHLALNETTISGCSATGAGGAIRQEGGMFTALNSTFYGNEAGKEGGAISLVSGEPAFIAHCTLTANSALTGGGLCTEGRVTLANSIIAGNEGATSPQVKATQSLSTLGGNLVSNNRSFAWPTGTPNASSDWVGSPAAPLDARLGSLGYHGGSTPTCLPLPGSPAIDNGITTESSPLNSPSTDQRSAKREDPPDIGAVEINWENTTNPIARLNDRPFFELTRPDDLIEEIAPAFSPVPATGNAALAIDNDETTSYLSNNRLQLALDLTPQIAPARVAGLRLTSALDTPALDPTSFALFGRSPGGAIELITTGKIPLFKERREQHELFLPSPSRPFQSFRLIFPTVAGPVAPGAENAMQIAEIELLGSHPHSRPRVQSFLPTNGSRQEWSLTWTSQPGHRYRLETSRDLRTWTREAEDDSGETTTRAILPRPEGKSSYLRVVDLSAPLAIDFNALNLNAGPYRQGGLFQNFETRTNVADDFEGKSFPAFGTTIKVTPEWPDVTGESTRRMFDQWPLNGPWPWDNAAGDRALIRDFIGVNTHETFGGNGDWDGAENGKPTYLTLTLGGLPAGNYHWTSFHHTIYHNHGFFQVEISVDGGETFVSLGQEFYQSNSSPGGEPDPATDGSPFGPLPGPDVLALPSTIRFPISATGAEVVLRFALLSGTLGEGFANQMFALNGFVLARNQAP